ncbi:Ni/Fe-hydrogenase 2 integral membrane subunit HybB [Malonomonas rubra DSM 5091]|uniref:Ni/Fe-hydrogenase 2 integral membrane subunit HybB n=1 Tax=Malonomonas rubra DSM 5091 TaxID=1122189 RepID=A0A1M6JQH4_MALRU|nr:NrfD/PsrC family molybdoenzyme membrane anchor subunit [Malonomonas rubra]SHJ49015.1 Ni/Fe-hydrogenase 2 integral membrane subunit HybB [Malonomonas rubra DSM 5091]
MTAVRAVAKEIKGYHAFVKFMIFLVVLAAVASLARFVFGLGATTNMDDTYPWGLWISFDVVTAVPLAAGAFTLGAIVHCFNIKKLEPLVRPAIVTGFLGYSLVCVGLVLDLGQPHKGWHVLRYWNLHSPMFEVAMCVMAYTTVLFLEFLSPVAEKFGWHIPLRILRWLEMPLVILAAAISTLHQSSLGTFFLIAVDKLHSLWYNPLLPLLFWVSAICCGMCIIIVEATACHKWMGQPNEGVLLRTLAKILPYTLGFYIFLRVYTLMALSEGPFFDVPVFTLLFFLELGIGFILPFLMFTSNSVRNDDRRRVIAALLVIFGLVLNRFNVSMFGMMDPNHMYYPSIIESLVTIGIIAGHILFFVLIAKYFPIFEHHPETVDYTIPDSFHKIDDGKPKQEKEQKEVLPEGSAASELS